MCECTTNFGQSIHSDFLFMSYDSFYLQWEKNLEIGNQKWFYWITDKGKVFLNINFPPTALIDKFGLAVVLSNQIDKNK
ncbi:hypothetical protein FACS189443_0490 [Planctomycetales bacterium]|nr:hypothetical protein FACS189443_0490 [Planctomycetales bacterium]